MIKHLAYLTPINQGDSAYPDIPLGCDEEATKIDDLDNLYCIDCAEQNIDEAPENWECG